MKKEIVIIGAGISGLTLLHSLKQKFKDETQVTINLYEKNDHPGGTIQSVQNNQCIFETGPNGFLDSKSETLQLVEELELAERLIDSSEESAIRYIYRKGKIKRLPTNPKSLLFSPLLTPLDKFRALKEKQIPKGTDPDETVYDFAKRRFGEKVAQVFFDPLVSGIYAGDAQKVNLKAAFPQIYQLEQEYGSLIEAGMVKKRERKNDNSKPTFGGKLKSFQEGMYQIVHTFYTKHQDSIHLNTEIKSITMTYGQYVLHTKDSHFTANELFLSTPAYSASTLLENIDKEIVTTLDRINYAPVAVVGLVYPKNIFKNIPVGFGYLVPSTEFTEILGVLFESQIFTNRCPSDQIMFRLMIGGMKNQGIINKSEAELVEIAINEINKVFNTEERLKNIFVKSWAKAIPQYDQDYVEVQKSLSLQLKNHPGLHLVANYRNGVSFNDCVKNARQEVQDLTLNF